MKNLTFAEMDEISGGMIPWYKVAACAAAGLAVTVVTSPLTVGALVAGDLTMASCIGLNWS